MNERDPKASADSRETGEEQDQPKPTLCAHRLCTDSDRRLSSSRPNQALVMALIDDSPLGAELREEARDIIEGWRHLPRWKGMLYDGGVWNGSTLEVPISAPVVYKPICYAEPSKVSPRLVQLFSRVTSKNVMEAELKEQDRAWKLDPSDEKNRQDLPVKEKNITVKELNDQYVAWEKNPADERDNLLVTIDLFSRSPQRIRDCKKLLKGVPDNATQVDDIFSEFALNLRHRMETGKYTHSGEFDGWIGYIWHFYFFPEQQTEVYDHVNQVRFINDDDAPESTDYTVYSKQLSSDMPGDDKTGMLHKIRREDGTFSTISCDTLWLQLDDPTTVLGKLNAASKKQLRFMVTEPEAQYLSKEEIAERLDMSLSTLYRAEQSSLEAGRKTLGVTL